jgi:hypothetical protein
LHNGIEQRAKGWGGNPTLILALRSLLFALCSLLNGLSRCWQRDWLPFDQAKGKKETKSRKC